MAGCPSERAEVGLTGKHSGHELLAIRIPGSDVWQLPTANQAQAWADGRITIGAELRALPE